MFTEDIKKTVTIQDAPRIKLNPLDMVTVERQGKNYTIVKWQLRQTKCHIKNLPGKKYQVLSTGEVKEMAKTTSKKNEHLRVTFEKLRGLIRHNFSDGAQNQVFVTLTYAHYERNPENCYDDFKKFWRRLEAYLPGHKLDYINVIEPQASGRWHFHTMIKSDQKELWIDKWDIKKMWEQGNAFIERLKSDDVGAYYVSYFTHLYDEAEAGDVDGAVKSLAAEETAHDPEAGADRMKLLKKAKIKGARLHYYPRDIKFFRCSRGILRPEKEKMYNGMVQEEKLGSLVYSVTKNILDEEGEIINAVQKDHYKQGVKASRKKKTTVRKGANPK